MPTLDAFSARDRASSDRWPACSQPMVGTSPTGRGSEAIAVRRSSRVRTTRGSEPTWVTARRGASVTANANRQATSGRDSPSPAVLVHDRARGVVEDARDVDDRVQRQRIVDVAVGVEEQQQSLRDVDRACARRVGEDQRRSLEERDVEPLGVVRRCVQSQLQVVSRAVTEIGVPPKQASRTPTESPRSASNVVGASGHSASAVSIHGSPSGPPPPPSRASRPGRSSARPDTRCSPTRPAGRRRRRAPSRAAGWPPARSPSRAPARRRSRATSVFTTWPRNGSSVPGSGDPAAALGSSSAAGASDLARVVARAGARLVGRARSPRVRPKRRASVVRRRPRPHRRRFRARLRSAAARGHECREDEQADQPDPGAHAGKRTDARDAPRDLRVSAVRRGVAPSDRGGRPPRPAVGEPDRIRRPASPPGSRRTRGRRAGCRAPA